jgi:hypothetical protein
MEKNVEVLLCYFINSLPFSGRTQLVKFMYLADLESRRLRGQPITDLRYIWYIHGPFDKRIYDTLDDLRERGYVREIERRFASGDKAYAYHLVKPIAATLHRHDRAIAEYVEKTFGKTRLRSLLDDVVYQTAPMIDAEERKAFKKPLRMSLADNENKIDLDRLARSVEQLKGGGGTSFDEIWETARKRHGEHGIHAKAV